MERENVTLLAVRFAAIAAGLLSLSSAVGILAVGLLWSLGPIRALLGGSVIAVVYVMLMLGVVLRRLKP